MKPLIQHIAGVTGLLNTCKQKVYNHTILLSAYSHNRHNRDQNSSQFGTECEHKHKRTNDLKDVPQQHGHIHLETTKINKNQGARVTVGYEIISTSHKVIVKDKKLTKRSSRGIEWSIRDFARLRDPCLTLRERDPNVNIESEPDFTCNKSEPETQKSS